MTAKEHNKTLGILFLVYLTIQILGLIVGVAAMLGMMGIVAFNTNGNGAIPAGLIFGVAIVALAISAVLLIPTFFAGWKMLKEKSNARIWGIIAAIIALINFPLGTASGIYALWFLFGEAGKQFYTGGNSTSGYPPPPPNSWQ